MESNVAFSKLREINCTIHWFQSWNQNQRDLFLSDLVIKALPEKVDLLLDAMGGMNVQDRPPNIFECQVRLFGQWFDEWSIAERNFMIERLESFDPVFVSKFYDQVRRSVGTS